LLAALAWWLDAGQVAQRISALRLGWVLVALALSVLQVAASAWRWRFTAGRLGIGLPFRAALREYYLASFLNQVLPGGVMGDVARAARHGRGQAHSGARIGPAVGAVILERASGQIVMAGAAAGSFFVLVRHQPWSGPVPWTASALAVLVLACGAALWLVSRIEGARAALLERGALPIQLGSSLLVVGSYIATGLLAARAIEIHTPAATLLPLFAPMLLAMLLPFTWAGWGVREGAAAALWAAVGLDPLDGTAISVAYGLIVLVASLPGALVLLGGAGAAQIKIEQQVLPQTEHPGRGP